MAMRTSVALALLLGFAVVACGSDDDGGGSGGGSNAAATASCNNYCETTASCSDFAFTDVAECKQYECDFSQLPAACAAAFKDYYDCVLAKSDVCDETGCQPDLDACM